MSEKAKFCGYVALLGRPNAGKSTLLNALVGQKVAGVSHKPQTTRNRILGVVTEPEHQILILDCPGIHSTKGMPKLNSSMMREVYGVLEEADLFCYLVDITRGLIESDLRYLAMIKDRTAAVPFIFLSKSDKLRRKELQEAVAQTKEALEPMGWDDKVHVLSSKRSESLDQFKSLVGKALPEGPFLFPEDEITDRSSSFLVGELIRESMFRSLGREIPYHAAAVVESMERQSKLTKIQAKIVVARSSQKGIVLGKRGAKIKEIGLDSRQKIESLLQRKVFLDLRVTVESGWYQDRTSILELTELEN